MTKEERLELLKKARAAKALKDSNKPEYSVAYLCQKVDIIIDILRSLVTEKAITSEDLSPNRFKRG